ncbi:MAG: phosphoglucomutase/phosphomannomutase family protein [Verrucomicrobia bacterium]|nr:phosphoglucomutase/phosphomannomutase family protein [Verrucomicrobiota bacterium]
MSHAPIKFGTDGWRAVIADEFTFDNVRRVAQATADYWNSQPLPKRAIVGCDNRFQSETFARLVAEVFSGNGITTYLPPVAVPTPAIAHAIRDRHLCGGVMITASHNPPPFNGYKIKAHYAGSADAGISSAVEQLLDRSPVRTGEKLIRCYDPRPAYLDAMRRFVDLKRIRRARLRIVTDSMHGCGGTMLADLLGATPIRANRDVIFGGIQPEPIERNLAALCAAVKQNRADIGLASDGDADRLGVVDERGRYVSVQIVHALLLLHLIRNRRTQSGSVVRAINSTMLIDRICRAHGVPLIEVPIGFRWACQQMREQDVIMAGEESGSFGFRGHVPERDGLLAALYLLELLAMTGMSLTELAAELQREFGRSAYGRLDLPVRLVCPERPRNLLGAPVVSVNKLDGVKYIAADGSWLMFRCSGTEPVTRIYCEAPNTRRVRRLLEWGSAVVSSE